MRRAWCTDFREPQRMRNVRSAGAVAAGVWDLLQHELTSVLQKHGRHHVGPHGSVRSVSRVGLLPKEKHARQATTRSRMRAESVEECGLRQCEKKYVFSAFYHSECSVTRVPCNRTPYYASLVCRVEQTSLSNVACASVVDRAAISIA